MVGDVKRHDLLLLKQVNSVFPPLFVSHEQQAPPFVAHEWL
jgi:hypothetical protein